MLYLGIGIIVIAALAIFLLKRQRFLSEELVKKSCNKIQSTSKLDPNHSLLESHKILIATIQQMNQGKKLTAVKTLNKVIKRLDNEKELWKFHRMRNLAAHELDYKVSEQEAKEARKIFKQSLKALTKS